VLEYDSETRISYHLFEVVNINSQDLNDHKAGLDLINLTCISIGTRNYMIIGF